MKWTAQQSEVIDSRGKNILVSAAAGSGKTAVLIERIKTLIIKDKVDVDRFLITTFTNAASAEMRERLEKAIRKEMEECEADTEFLKKQLSLIPRANIGTFHNFALEVMRQYFYLTDLEPGFAIGDERRIGIMEREALDELIESRFAEDYCRFTDFLTKYGSDRNEEKIKDSILSLYKELRSIPDYMNWARARIELYKSEEPAAELNLMPFLLDEVRDALGEAKAYYEASIDILMEHGLDRLADIARRDMQEVISRLEAADRLEAAEGIGKRDANTAGCYFEEMSACIRLPKLTSMRANAEEKEEYALCKEAVSQLRKKAKGAAEDVCKKLFYMSLDEINEEFGSQYDDVSYFVQLVDDFQKSIREKKNNENLVDFDDAMHYAIEILSDTGAAEEYRSRFEYIFIDEFQDSNMLQEEIISRIAGDNNVFMVGDVKQSIYKFRLAEPEIFKRKYEKYALESETGSKKIDLNMNFRSKSHVVDTVNEVFGSIMDGYDENARLNCGVGREHMGYGSRLHLIDGEDKKELPEEAVVANIIKSRLGNDIFDTKEGVTRRAGYGDIVVLARSRTAIASLERYLNNEGIPAYGEGSGGYFSTVEILVFVNILRVIDNTRQDVPLISAMRSVVFDFSIRDLAQIRIENREGSFYNAVKAYSQSGSNSQLRERLISMLEDITYWRKLSRTVPLEDLVRTLIYDTGYYDYCSGLPMGKQRTSNLKLLIEKAAEFEESSFSGLFGFLSYVDAMDKNRLNVGEAKVMGENEDVVRVMTVHKSKGLEFPIVILASAGRSIRGGALSGSGLVHKDFAVTLPVVNTEYLWHRKSYLQNIIARKKSREQYDEEVRILYVALTRAKDSLAIVGTVKDVEAQGTGVGRKSSFVDMVYGAFEKNDWEIIKEEPFEEAAESTLHESRHLKDLSYRMLMKENDEKGERYEEIHSILSFEYPYMHLGKVKSKYSVTELIRRGEDRAMAPPPLTTPIFLNRERKLSAAEIGTAMHLVMEKLDFGKALSAGREYIEETIEGLYGDGLLAEDEKKAISSENIAGFFQNDIGRRAAGADVLEKEREFLKQVEIDGVDTIVQGVIDCYFEEADGIVLIDYKNSYLDETAAEIEIIRRYSQQLVIYKEALEAATGKKVKEAYLYLFKSGKFVSPI